jgi:ERCC4-type nuclease
LEKKRQNPNLLIWYIVEGFSICDKTKSENVGNTRINRDTILASILNTVLRDNFYTISTRDVEETTYIIDQLPSKLKEHGIGTVSISAVGTESSAVDYASTIQLKKKDNLTPTICFQLMLAQIPGVSTTMAGTIVNQYNSMSELCSDFNRIEDIKKRKVMLTKVEGIGKIIAGRIHDYLYNLK